MVEVKVVEVDVVMEEVLEGMLVEVEVVLVGVEVVLVGVEVEALSCVPRSPPPLGEWKEAEASCQ